MPTVAEQPPSVQPLADAQWRHAVVKAAEALQARPFMPPLADRLMRGMDVALSGKVTVQDDTATVQSGSRTYTLAPHCTCQYAEHKSRWCKHAIAVELFTLAHKSLAGASRNGTGNGTEPPAREDGFSHLEREPTTPPAPPEARQPQGVQTLPEAPASICMRWEDHGISMQLTLRDRDDAALFARVKAVLPTIKATVQAQQQADCEAAEAGTIPADAWCTTHQVRMKRYTKGAQTWHSHKLADGRWCNGRV